MQDCRGCGGGWGCVCTTGKTIKEISMNSNCMFIDGASLPTLCAMRIHLHQIFEWQDFFKKQCL